MGRQTPTYPGRDHRKALTPVQRWTPERKAAVVLAMRSGEVSADELIAAHGLTAEELGCWNLRHHAHGEAGLAITKLQAVRS